MKLNKLTIDNFHCYQHAEFELGEKTTVLIGKNGTGKSSVLKALRAGLSVFFNRNRWNNEGTFSGPVPGLKPIQLSASDFWHDKNGVGAQNARITSTNTLFLGKQLPEWSYDQDLGNKTYAKPTKFKDAYLELVSMFAQSSTFPLFAYYSDRFPHIENKISPMTPAEEDVFKSIDPRWGYWRWDKEPSALKAWQKKYSILNKEWFDFRIQMIEEGVEDSHELSTPEKEKYDRLNAQVQFIKDIITKFTTKDDSALSFDSSDWCVKAINIDHDSHELKLRLDDGTTVNWDEMPAGYERLLNIVFDIAYRSLLLNGPDKEVRGVVIIDEIDLHLHPSLQRDVLQRFRLAFPEVQFIVTTHSPIVISHFPELEGNKVIQLEHVNEEYTHYDLRNWYGFDYSIVLSLIMGTDAENKYLNTLVDRYVRHKSHGYEDKARSVMDTIEVLVHGESLNRVKKLIAEQLED